MKNADYLETICFHCGNGATLLCDYVVGVTIAGYGKYRGVPYPVMSLESEFITCDRPLCYKCATNKGITFYCGTKCGAETRDFCKDHLNCDGDTIKDRIMSKEEIMQIKNRLHIRQIHGVKAANDEKA